jgi:hypothetical protein
MVEGPRAVPGYRGWTSKSLVRLCGETELQQPHAQCLNVVLPLEARYRPVKKAVSLHARADAYPSATRCGYAKIKVCSVSHQSECFANVQVHACVRKVKRFAGWSLPSCSDQPYQGIIELGHPIPRKGVKSLQCKSGAAVSRGAWNIGLETRRSNHASSEDRV